MSEHDEADQTAARLQARLAEVWNVPVAVQGLRRLSGGASRHTWSLEAGPVGGTPQPLILRCDPPARPRPELMALERAALTAAASVRVPVPRVVDHGDGQSGGEAALGQAYLLMERVDGETIPRRLLRDERFAAVRPKLAREFGRILARIHSIPREAVPGLPDGDPLEQLTAMYRALDEPRPAIELGLRRLAENRPPARPAAVVHGDFRNGNLMVNQDGVRAVLDWELVHLSDPIEDLGWLCVKAWRFGSADPVGGFGPRDELLEGYAEVAGIRPSDDELHWWEVFGTVRWAVICRKQAERYLSGADRSVEFAVLGRRVCEQEHDILLSLGATGPGAVPDVLAGWEETEPAAPHDRPGAGALLQAVHGFLTEEVAAGSDARLRFLARVAANAVAIARREALLGPGHDQVHQARLAVLGCADDRELAEAIRDGSLDGRWEEAVDTVRRSIIDKLAVANPDYAVQPAG
ncbi:phosphotransferase family protein [Streptomyces melanosporofaciens]|uniref:Predicted kinase, aminoglycoside phosphotransferase (APT) family n=1 Tax=Streptomyces melanosporofaciens TaxID=67327 RepID=A0A1H4KM26_STRMJ|nr:phosphotransferase family protein [Streptomyces melanosporofaciens]SEB59614.1 Predicted kinase, aminoglycoside phosphotransferase (APT) family [Streptomyces melanosporofaciens]